MSFPAKLTTGLLCVLSVSAAAEERKPTADMDFYTQEFTVEFANEVEAKKAEIAVLSLYRGYELAVTSRWDDNNCASLKMRDVLDKHGYKGVWYLNASFKGCWGNDYGRLAEIGGPSNYGRELLKGGHCVAGHTLEHHWMEAMSRNKMWHEVMAVRVDREAELDVPIALWGVGFGFTENLFEPDKYFPDLDEMGRRSGMYGRFRWGLPGDGADIDDAFAEWLKDEEAREKDPIISHGYHVLYDTPEKWDKFEGQLRKYGRKPKWWYCNYSEYAAYRQQYLNAKMDVKREGAVVAMTLRRPVPIDLGDGIPVTLTVKGATPKRVECATARVEKTSLAVGGSGYNLYHDVDKSLPAKIDAVEDGGGTSKDFPFLTATLAKEGSGLLLKLGNSGKDALTGVRVVYRLPLAWDEGAVKKRLADLEGGKSARDTLKLKPLHQEYRYRHGRTYYAAQVDFRRRGEAGRLYVTCFDDVELKEDTFPANGFWVLGPLPASESEALKVATEVSSNNRKGSVDGVAWRRIKRVQTDMLDPEFVFTMGSDHTEIGEYHFLLLTSVRSDRKRAVKHLSYPSAVKALYLNGKRQAGNKLALKKGKNELMLLCHSGVSEFSPLHYGFPFRLVHPESGKRLTDVSYDPEGVRFSKATGVFSETAETRKKARGRLFEDFEDGNFWNLAGTSSIGKSNGEWQVAPDKFGESKAEMKIEADPDGKSGQALHVTGFMGTSVAPKWVGVMLWSALSGEGQNATADLTGSIGISFKARSNAENAISVGIDAIVNGKNLVGIGRSHRTTVKMGKEWRTHNLYWTEFAQPFWACPGDDCVDGPLTVDQVGFIGWNATEEGKALDFWLDDVEILYGRK